MSATFGAQLPLQPALRKLNYARDGWKPSKLSALPRGSTPDRLRPRPRSIVHCADSSRTLENEDINNSSDEAPRPTLLSARIKEANNCSKRNPALISLDTVFPDESPRSLSFERATDTRANYLPINASLFPVPLPLQANNDKIF